MSLPKILIDRYKDWKLKSFNQNKLIYRKIGSVKQEPKAMIISCCDSRVQENIIFNANPGDFFIHKNIANLILPYKLIHQDYNTSSAIEYAVKSLKVPHIIILGHSNCGGINHAFNISKNNSKDNGNSSLNNWLNSVIENFSSLKYNNKENNLSFYEKESIKNSLKNLVNYPYIKKLVNKNELELHALWYEIKSGKIMFLNHSSGEFENL